MEKKFKRGEKVEVDTEIMVSKGERWEEGTYLGDGAPLNNGGLTGIVELKGGKTGAYPHKLIRKKTA